MKPTHTRTTSAIREADAVACRLPDSGQQAARRWPTQVTVVRPGELTQQHLEAWSRIQRGNPLFDSPFFRPEFMQQVARCRADVGRIHAVGAGADFTRGTDMGRRSAAASCRPCACAILGSVSARSAARANMGLALARAERLRAASCTVMGGA